MIQWLFAQAGVTEALNQLTEQISAEVSAPDHSGWYYLWVFLSVLAGFLMGKFLKLLAEQTAKRGTFREGGFRAAALSLAARSVVFPSAGLGVCGALWLLDVTGKVAEVRYAAFWVLLIVIVTYVLYQLIELVDYWISRLAAKTTTTLDDMMAPLVRKTLRTIVVLFGLVGIVERLSGQTPASIITGLGVGGLAVALAAQDTVKNFFGSLVLFADQPFQLGDRVVVDGEDGTVEEVGMRSSRIRTLDGHLVTVPNGDLANKMIRNISKRPFIKRVANITLTYDTPPEKVELAMQIMKEFLEGNLDKQHPDFPPRVYFNNFNDCSLNILVIYWFAPPAYWDFLDFDQEFNLTLLRRFNEEGIEFAFPTQTVHLADSGGSDSSSEWV